MAFEGTPAFTGVPEFGIIHITPEETAKAFQVYLDTASKLTGVSLDDISVSVIDIPADPKNVNLAGLIGKGMKLFDAVVWLHAGRPVNKPLVKDVTMKVESIPSMHEIARSVFYCYFMLLTQARYPAPASASEKPRIPNFLRTIMGMEKDQSYYIEMICSFAPQKFDPAWVKFIDFSGFGQEVLSRFGLGVAGYRMFGPFGLYAPRSDMPLTLQPAFAFARKLATSAASWSIHPLTRAPSVLTIRGNLNKNLGNLILDSFTEEQINEMVEAKILFKKPIREVAHRNYLQWTEVDDISGSGQIFK